MAQISDKDIADYVTQNLSNPQAIADAAKLHNVGLNDLVRATGYDTNTINSYFGNAKITPYWAQTTPVNNGIAGLPAAQTVPSFTQPITSNQTGAVRSVIEGDNIDDQIANLPEEYANWHREGQYMVLNRKSDGQELDRRIVPVMSDTQLLTTGLSMVPGAAPFVQGFNALNAAKSGDVLGLVSNLAGVSGATDVANVANLANAAKNKDALGMVLSGSNVAGVNDIGGMSIEDLSKLVGATNAIKTGDVAGILNSAVGYSQPSGTIETTPVDTGTNTRNLATQDINSSIAAPTDTQSLLDILGDSSNQIISDAPFVAAPDTQGVSQRQPTDYSKRSFNSAFAAARALGEPDFTWKGQTFTTELAPKLNAGPASDRTIKTGPGMDPVRFANWGGRKIDPNLMKTAAPNLGWDPSTYFPKIDVRMADPTSALGNVPETGYRSNQQTYLNLAPYLTKLEAKNPGVTADVLSHELGHVGQVLSSKPGEDISKLYLRMAHQAGLSTTDAFNRPSDVTKFNQALNAAIPYISETYGTNAGSYLGNPKAPLFEKLTDLAAIEMQTGKDLTKDPVLKETLFNDPKVIAMYNTLTIPRMSRLDPRDLPTGTVTASDFPKGETPWGMRFRNMLPSPTKSWVQPYAAGGLAGGGLTEDKAKALADAYAAGDISTVNQLLNSGISAEDVKSYWGFTDADIAGLSGAGIKFTQPTNTITDTSNSTDNTQTTTNDFLNLVSPPASNITSTGGVTKSATAPTSGGVSNVIEGDDIETQIAQLPDEYAHWSRSADQRSMELIRKSDGAILDRRTVGDFSDLDLAKIGLSFIPGAGPILAGLNVADAARRGDLLQAAIGVTGLVPGMQNVGTALKVGQAIDQNNPFGAVTALAGNTDLQKLVGFDSTNIGGFTSKDIIAGANLAKAAGDNNYAGVLTSLGTLTGSSDTALAGRALALYNRLQRGDTSALNEAVNLSNSVVSGATTGSTGGTSGSTTVGDFEDTEVTRLKGLGYTKEQIQEYFRNLDNLTEVLDTGTTGTAGTTTSGLPTGTQLASVGSGFDVGTVSGAPIFAESSNAGSITAPFGYRLTSASETDDKPAGSFYDPTTNAWFSPDTAVTDLTGSTSLQADADLFNSSIGTLDQLDTTRSADEFADFLESIGITNTTQLADSGLSNQDILNMINATDDTVVVTGGGGNDTVTGVDTITGAGGNDNVETVTVTGGRGNDTVTNVDTLTGGGGNDDTITVVGERPCAPGFHDDGTGFCVPDDDGPIVCPPGKVLNADGTACIPVIEIKDTKCDPGYVYDEDLKQCVPVEKEPLTCTTGFHPSADGLSCEPDDTKKELECPEGYEPNDDGTACIPVVVIKDKRCDPGYVYDEDLKQCMPIKEDEPCAEGFHLENGLCVPDDDGECKTGYEKVNGVCVPVCKEGYIRNLATGVCEKVETKDCPPGQMKNAEGKCVPIFKTEECKPGFEKVNGVCVPVCQPGYQRVNGVCKKIATDVIPTPTGTYYGPGEKNEPIYAGGMDEFNLLATLEELLKESSTKKDTKETKQKTKMATGGHLDDLLAEQMTVDDLLKLLR